MIELSIYAGLFAVAFAAATVLPMQSEAALAGLLLTDAYSTVLLIAVASVGNILGSVVNWLLGRSVDAVGGRAWPANSAMIDRATGWYRRYGRWSLLLSWAPVVGDPITVVAGMLREPLWSFVALVTIAKTARYLAVAAAAFGAT